MIITLWPNDVKTGNDGWWVGIFQTVTQIEAWKAYIETQLGQASSVAPARYCVHHAVFVVNGASGGQKKVDGWWAQHYGRQEG